MEMAIKVLNVLLVAVLFIASVLVDKGEAFECYQCNSTSTAECLEKFPSEASLRGSPCNVAEARYCVKVTGVWGAVVGTYRFCSSKDLGNQCQYFNFDDHDRTYRGCVHTCSSNNCNGSSGLTGNIFMSLSIAAVLLMFWVRS